MARRHRAFAVISTAAVVAALAVPAGRVHAAAASAKPNDFNGDGVTDLAIGAPESTVSGKGGAGLVTVIYGSKRGPQFGRRQSISQDSPGIVGAAASGERFGAALTSGDYDGDGYADLAVGAPRETVGSHPQAGSVTVVYGGPNGLDDRSQVLFSQLELTGRPGAAANNDFGGALATVEREDSKAAVGYDDLVVGGGVPDLLNSDTGKVITFFFGGPAGLANRSVDTYSSGSRYRGDALGRLARSRQAALALPVEATRNQWTVLKTPQDTLGASGTVSDDPKTMVKAIACGDVNGDRRLDLVFGWVTPADGFAGKITIVYGKAGPRTFDPGRVQHIDQDTPGVPDKQERADLFGFSLAVGDLNRDGRDDIVVGQASETVGEVKEAGAMTVLYGRAGGVTGAGAQFFHQDAKGVPGRGEKEDEFATALALQDLDKDGRLELLVGVAGEDSYKGSVLLFRTGAKGRLTAAGAKTISAGAGGGGFGSVFSQ